MDGGDDQHGQRGGGAKQRAGKPPGRARRCGGVIVGVERGESEQQSGGDEQRVSGRSATELSLVSEVHEDPVAGDVHGDRGCDQRPRRPGLPSAHAQYGDYEDQPDERREQERLRRRGRSLHMPLGVRGEQDHGRHGGGGQPGEQPVERQHHVEAPDARAREQHEGDVGERERDEQEHLRASRVPRPRI